MIFKGKGLRAEHFNKKVNYIIDEFLVQGAITLLYAPPKKGKSSFAMGLTKYLIDNTTLYPLYLDFDNPIIALEDRGINKVIHEYMGRFEYVHPDIVCMTGIEAINAMVKDCEGGADYSNVVLLLDSATNFVDVMDDRATTSFMNKLKILRNAGATIIILHHTNKSEQGYKGSSNFRSDCDNVFMLTSESANSLEDYILLNSESARFGKIRNSAFVLKRETWNITKISYDDVCMPYHVREFIREIKQVLQKEKQLNQTKLLEAIGKDKRDKTSAELLAEYSGRYWTVEEKGNSKIYTLK
ncbi:MAG: AAA family ATPase [Arcobacteraceae bacterium]|jgi:RecA-family ATPase|nr:AAA family ATPase [Arcobacteraceae bacterium]